MGIFEIISAILLILACVFIIVVVLLQDTKQGMSQTITGGSADNYFQKNSGRSKEAQLSKATRNAAIVFFVVALAVNVINVYFGGSAAADTTSNTPAVTSQVEALTSDTTSTDAVENASTDAVESAAADTAENTSTDAAETTAADTTAADTAETTAPADTTAADTSPAETTPAETTAAAE